MSWKPPIFWPNCSLVLAYSAAVSKQVLAAPVTPHRMPNRASDRHESGPFRPRTPGRTALPGSFTSSKCSSEVTEARRDIFLWMFRVVKPRAPRGTRKPRMPSSVLAQTTAMSAMPPLVIHILEPLRTQSAPFRFAWVFMLDGSEP